MLNKVFLCVILASLVSAVVAPLAVSSSVVLDDLQEPFDAMLSRYVDEASAAALLDAASRREFNERWLTEILSALKDQNEPSAERTGAVGVGMSLAIGLGELDTAAQLSQDLYYEVGDDPLSKAQALQYRAEVAMAQARTKRTPKQIQGSIQRAEQFLTEAFSITGPDTWSGLDPRGLLHIRPQLWKELAIIKEEAKLYGDAADAYDQLLDEVVLLRHVGQDATLSSQHEETYSQQAAFLWAQAGDMDKSFHAIERIEQIKNARNAPSVYVWQAGNRFSQSGHGAFHDFAQSWLSTHQRDNWTPALEFYLALDLVGAGDMEEALPIFLNLREEHLSDLQRLDRENGVKQQVNGEQVVGFGPMLLRETYIALRTKGHLSAAKDIWSQIQHLYPVVAQGMRSRGEDPGH